MEIEEVVGLGSNDSQDSDSPRRGGVSPLPQIRTVVLTDPRVIYINKIYTFSFLISILLFRDHLVVQ